VCAVRRWGNPHRFPFIGVYWPRALLLGVFFCLAARELFGFGVGLPWLPSRGNPMNCSGYRALSQAAGGSSSEQLFGESPGQRSESPRHAAFPWQLAADFPGLVQRNQNNCSSHAAGSKPRSKNRSGNLF